MTLPAVIPSVTYDGSEAGTRGPFSFARDGTPIRIDDDTHVEVVKVSTAGGRTTLVRGVDYTLAGTADAKTATIAADKPALLEGESLILRRRQPIQQSVGLTYAAAFPSASVEGELDRINQRLQELADTITDQVGLVASGSIVEKVIATSGQTVFNLTSATYTPNANNIEVYVDGLRLIGGGEDYTETDLDTVTFTTGRTEGEEVVFVIGRSLQASDTAISPAMRPVAQAPTTAAGRLALGISSAMDAVVTAVTTFAACRAMGVPAILNDLAALAAATWTEALSPHVVILRRNHVRGDGDAIFDLDETDTSTAHDGVLVVVTASGRRYKRRWSGSADVRWWGVRADGSTDDTAALQAAINTTAASDFMLPPADVRVSGITILRDNIHIRGVLGKTRLVCTHETNSIITIGDGVTRRVGVFLSDFRFWASVTKTDGWCIYARGLLYSGFDNIDLGNQIDRENDSNINRLHDGIYFERFGDVYWRGFTWLSGKAFAMRGDYVGGVQVFGAECELHGHIGYAGETGVHIGGCSGGIYMHHLKLSACETGVLIDTALAVGAGIAIANAYNREVFLGTSPIDLCRSWGVDIGDGGCETVDMSDTWISACGDNAAGTGGIRVQPKVSGGVSVAIKAIGLRVQSCGYDGVQINDGNINWVGGFCRSNGAGANGGHGLLIGSTAAPRSIVQGVSIHNNGNSTRGDNIQIGAAADNFSIVDNDLFSPGASNLINNAGYGPTKRISGNRGFVTENSGQATILNGNSVVTVTHGCDAVPNYPVITNIGHGSAGPQVQALTSTTFQIALGSAVGADTPFQWTINAL